MHLAVEDTLRYTHEGDGQPEFPGLPRRANAHKRGQFLRSEASRNGTKQHDSLPRCFHQDLAAQRRTHRHTREI